MTLEEIIENRTLGSVELCLEVNKLISKSSDSLEQLEKVSAVLRNELFFFTTISNYLDKLESYTKAKDLEGIKNYCEYFNLLSTTRNHDIYNNVKKHIEKYSSFLTISNSKTVEEILNILSKERPDISVFALRSLPVGEGEVFTNRLKKLGINCELIEDYQVVEYTENTDCVLMGADSLLASENIVNKVGSQNLAILCEYFKKPVYVLADQTKKTSQMKFIRKERDITEIFEEVDNSLITKIITD